MRGLKAYKKTAITTSDPMDLLVALYDGFLRFGMQAREQLQREDRGAAGASLSKAIAIVNELNVSLDSGQGEEFAERLGAVYTFVMQELVQCNLKGDPERLDAVLELMRGLRDAWAEAAVGLRSRRFQLAAG